jgi:hypothetical protein
VTGAPNAFSNAFGFTCDSLNLTRQSQ